MKRIRHAGLLALATLLAGPLNLAQAPHVAPPAHTSHVGPREAANVSARPKLVVLIVVDQMRGDYVDKFKGQWTGGLKRLLQEGAWFHAAAYPYAKTETCVGHATISTGALPATHGIVANAWWDRETQEMVTCTADPRAKTSAAGDPIDSSWRLRVPTFADELKFQGGGKTRAVAFSLKARSAIMLGGSSADAEIWLRNGSWVNSSELTTLPFVDQLIDAHPVKEDYGKTWVLALPKDRYFYPEQTPGAVAPAGWTSSFPHPLRGNTDEAFYEQWSSSPFADTYLTKLAENAVDRWGLGNNRGTDFLAISYSSVDYVGHAFGPRSWEIQDILVRLDGDLGELFAHLDARVGRGNYLVAFSADHGVAPVPEDMQKTGTDAGVLHIPEVQEKIEKALQPFNYSKPAVAQIASSDVYFSTGTYDKLKNDPTAMKAVLDAIRAVPGVADVYRAEELRDRPATQSPIRGAEADSYFEGRSGDLSIVPRPYWLFSAGPVDQARSYGTGHGTPYNYDQHVPIFLMGWGIAHGEHFGAVTPADIAPTLASLCGVTLATRDGRVLAEALKNPIASTAPHPAN